MFQLTKNEVEYMVSQNAIPSKQYLGGSMPYVFTEQGVSMLSAILRSETAVNISIHIIRAFVQMKKIISINAKLFNHLNIMEQKQLVYQNETDKKFNQILDALKTNELQPKQGIFYKDQIFDAYTFVVDLIRLAKKFNRPY